MQDASLIWTINGLIDGDPNRYYPSGTSGSGSNVNKLVYSPEFQNLSHSHSLASPSIPIIPHSWQSGPVCNTQGTKQNKYTPTKTDFLYFLFTDIQWYHHHHHHHVVPPARISLTLSHHFSLSFIAPGKSSELHPVSSHSWCMYVRAGRPAFASPYVGVHRSTSLMSSFLLLLQCPACLVRLTWIVFVMGGRLPYNWCFVGCCLQDLFYIACNILV